MTASVPIQCDLCRHYLRNRRCRAFPDGIPQSILLLRHDHRLEYPGDSGLRFEPSEAWTEEEVQALVKLYETLGRAGAIAPELREGEAG